MDATDVFTQWIAKTPVNVVAASGTALAIPDTSTGALQHLVTLTGNCTLTFPTAAAGKRFTLILLQDATGARTVTWPTITWVQGTPAAAPVPVASSATVYDFVCLDGSTWVGLNRGYSPMLDQFRVPAASLVYTQGASTTAAQALVTGRATWLPIVLDQGTYDALCVNLATAQSGGASTFSLGLFGTDASGFPDTVTGSLLSSTVDLTTTTGSKMATGTTVALRAGLYWTGSLYVQTSAPTTQAQLQCVSNNAYVLPSQNFQTPQAARAWSRTGVTVFPTDATTFANRTAVGTNDAPLVGVRKAS